MGYATDPIVHDMGIGKSRARLIEAREFDWHRKKCQEEHRVLRPADPELFNLNTLQSWLWRRLQAPATEVFA